MPGSRLRTLVVVLGLLTVFAPHSVGAGDHGDVSRPDIIVVMVDDLGAIDERVLSRLPNIRSLWLEGGLRFDAAYSETPLCCPGRAAFLTGQHTRTHGVVRQDARLLDPSQTIATALHDVGYQTIQAGKYLNAAALLDDKTPAGWDHVAMLDWTRTASRWWVDDTPTTAGFDDRFTLDIATTWLAAAPVGQPVFMWLNPRAPHWATSSATPWQPSIEPQYVGDARCSGIEPWKPVSYRWKKQPNGFPLDEICRSLLTTDEMVGALRAVAAANGRDPVWMFTSDNGMAWGAHGFPLKNVPEAGRLPVYFAGPGVIHGSTTALVSNIDFGPTLADLARTRMSAAQGVSFASLLRGEPGGRAWMLEDHPIGGATYGPWKGPWWGVRTPTWHLVQIGWRKPQLFDLTSDPWEMRNVQRTHRGLVSDMMASGIAAMPGYVPPTKPTPPPTPTPPSPPPSTPPPETPPATLPPLPTATATESPTATPTETPTLTFEPTP